MSKPIAYHSLPDDIERTLFESRIAITRARQLSASATALYEKFVLTREKVYGCMVLIEISRDPTARKSFFGG